MTSMPHHVCIFDGIHFVLCLIRSTLVARATQCRESEKELIDSCPWFCLCLIIAVISCSSLFFSLFTYHELKSKENEQEER